MCRHCFRLQKAEFDPFLVRLPGGVLFASRTRSGAKFRDRHWPVFAPARRYRRRRRPNDAGPCWQKAERALMKACNLDVGRRWLPGNPLDAHAMRVEDAWRRRRRG